MWPAAAILAEDTELTGSVLQVGFPSSERHHSPRDAPSGECSPDWALTARPSSRDEDWEVPRPVPPCPKHLASSAEAPLGAACSHRSPAPGRGSETLLRAEATASHSLEGRTSFATVMFKPQSAVTQGGLGDRAWGSAPGLTGDTG